MSETTLPVPPAGLSTAAVNQVAGEAVQMAGAIMHAPLGSEPSWAKPIVAILSLVLFGCLVVVAYVTNDHDMKMYLSASVVSMATTAVAYYLGSSSGSAHKTALLAAAPAIASPPAA